MYLEQFPMESRNHGWVEVICGSMFSGKTEELIRRLKRVEFANQKFLLFKPKTDNRYDGVVVKSHKGSVLDGILIENANAVFQHITDEKVIAFDEVQFFDMGIIDVVKKLADDGFRVICAGLDMDFQGNPFGAVPHLLATAEYVKKVHAICVNCGNLAYISHRTAGGTAQVLVGASEKYKPLCRSCNNREHA
ncbi:MAG TPA: thymidine kinase [Crocinitomicaceae bacterium]|nr:thymidine kinase [Crocinitomicaceae bacterium]